MGKEKTTKNYTSNIKFINFHFDIFIYRMHKINTSKKGTLNILKYGRTWEGQEESLLRKDMT